MALAKIQKTIFKVNSNTLPAAGHTYSIQNSGGGSAIPIYANSSGTVPLDNPGTLPANGLLSFFVRSGTCRIKINGPEPADEQIWDNEPCISPDVLSSASATLQFATITDLINCNPINKGETIDPADYVGQKVSTVVNNATSKKGGAEYIIKTAAQVSNDGYVIDGHGSHWLLGGNSYAAVLVDQPTIENFGATFGPDDTAPAQALMNYCNTFGTIELSNRRSILDKPVLNVGDIDFDHVNIIGNDNAIKAVAGATNVLIHEASGDWDYCRIDSLKIDGNGRIANGITFKNPFGGRIQFDKFRALNCDTAILKSEGNIGNTYYDLSISYCNYGMYCTSVSSPVLMHSGADILYHGHFSNCENAAIYIDSPASGTGQFVLDGTILEYNQGFGIFVENFLGAGNPFELRNVWFEGNHSSTSVDIRGATYTPKDMYLKNVSQGKIYGTVINSVYIEASDFTIDTGKTFSGTYDFEAVNSRIRFYNCLITGDMVFTNCDVASYDSDIGGGYIKDIEVVTAKVLRNGLRLRQLARLIATNAKNLEGGSFVTSYDGMRPFGSLIPDFGTGGLFPFSLNGTASGASRVDGYTFPVTASLFYYIKCEIKLNSGSDTPQCSIQGTGSVISDDFSSLLKEGEWVTVHLIGQATNTGSVGFWLNANGGNIDVNFGACTVVQVTNFSKIQRFYNDNTHIMQNGDYRFYASSLPATINNATQGDEVIKLNPTVDGNNMMLNGWRYDGSTWRPQYSSSVSPAT